MNQPKFPKPHFHSCIALQILSLFRLYILSASNNLSSTITPHRFEVASFNPLPSLYIVLILQVSPSENFSDTNENTWELFKKRQFQSYSSREEYEELALAFATFEDETEYNDFHEKIILVFQDVGSILINPNEAIFGTDYLPDSVNALVNFRAERGIIFDEGELIVTLCTFFVSEINSTAQSNVYEFDHEFWENAELQKTVGLKIKLDFGNLNNGNDKTGVISEVKYVEGSEEKVLDNLTKGYSETNKLKVQFYSHAFLGNAD